MRPFLVAAFLFMGAQHVVSADASASEITPGHVWAEVRALRGDLQILANALDVQDAGRPRISVTKAQPSEVYFAARALLRKTEQLVFERLRVRSTSAKQPVPPSDVEPADVLDLVRLARKRIGEVQLDLDVDVDVPTPEPLLAATPSDVFIAIQEGSYQLDEMLLTPVAPRDTYARVTLAIHHAARLLASHGAARRFPPRAPVDETLGMADIHESLVQCFALVEAVAAHSEVSVLVLDASAVPAHEVQSRDNYGLATLLVAELARLHAARPDAGPVVPSYDPGPRTPAEVAHRVATLHRQLEMLTALVDPGEAHP